MTAHMFAAIRRGKLKPGMADEFAKRVKAGGEEDTVMAVSLFTSKTAAEQSNAKLMPWIRENLGPLFASPTEATEGEVVISEVA